VAHENLLVSADEDRDHVHRVLAGDTDAFEAIVRRWQGPLVNLAYRFCRDRHRAEEMAQDAFVRAFRNLSSWRGDAAFSTWLFALAGNLYRSEIRRLPPRPLPFDQVVEPADPAPDAAGDLQARESARVVREAVYRLPSHYRDPMLLYYFYDRNVAAVAASLELPTGTVKARLARARDLLKTKLRELL
jgi:RNA polymerase sigma-70 factor (ECF subfamily)